MRLQFIRFMMLILVMLSGCGSYTYKNTQLTPPDRAFDFRLIDQNEVPQTLSTLRGNVVLIFFGYTNCPDICPATLSDMQLIYNRLGDDSEHVRMVFITVDPERDTPAKLNRYVQRFDSRIMALTGDPHALQATYAAYGAGATRRELPDSALKYAMDHTATVTVVDKQGMRRLLIAFASNVDDTVADIQTLINE